jgi:hypothetical protein
MMQRRPVSPAININFQKAVKGSNSLYTLSLYIALFLSRSNLFFLSPSPHLLPDLFENAT